LVRYHVGIDVGKHQHHACVCDTVTNQYGKVMSFSVDREGFERFLSYLEQTATKDEILVGVEASGPYALTIVYFLIEHGYVTVEVNPYQAAEFRRSQGKKAKTDRVDARSLAAFLMVGSYKRIPAANPLLENLRELTRFRADLLQDRTRQLNRLQETVTEAFPELGNHLASLDSPTALALLAAYPGPEALAKDPSGVVVSLSKVSHGQVNQVQAEAIIESARLTVGLMHRELALNLKLRLLSEAILSLNVQIKEIETAITELFKQFPHKPSDFPVGGVQSLASILAEIDDINQFATLKQFLSHFGWCPKTFQTGVFSLDHPRMSHAGNPYVRRVIWMLAILAVKTVSPFKDYFQRRTAAGKKKMHSIVAVARKILSIIYAVLKTGNPYNPLQEVPSNLAPART
jgi:transposase